MGRSTAQQLPLPCTFEEATSLLDDLTALRHTVTWQRAKITAAYAEIARMVVFNRARTLPDWLSQELRRLLTMAHPDKWSQGQPATALAHEVTVALNTLRQRLGEVQV